MALPASGSVWPPKPFDTALALINEHDAWYVGDTTRLAGVYGGTRAAARVRSSQHSGGVVGVVARFFWGRPIPEGQSRTRLHVPLPADIATTSADLLFSEPPRILLPKDEGDNDHAAQARLEEIMNTPLVHAGLLEAAEVAAAHGGTYLRITWDTDVADHPLLGSVAADGAIPEWRHGMLVGVTFWTVVAREGQIVWRHLERHEPGRILHGLYQGTSTDLGHARPLDEQEATAWAAELVDAEGAIATGSTRLTAAYVPNIRPQRRWRRTPDLSPLGRSDFDGIEPVFDAVDEAYSSWMRDIRLARARVFVDQSMLTNNGPGSGASFDDERELFTTLAGTGSMQDGATITAQQFAIRWEEHQRTIQDLTRVALRSAGYSPASFGDDSVSVQETATQVMSKQQLSERTRDKKIRYWKAALGPLAAAMLDVDAHVFGANQSDPKIVPEVRFPEKANAEPEDVAQTIALLDQASAISTDLKVRMFHPDWDAAKVDEEVERIRAENTVPDPALFRPGIDGA
ncbi:hypothetical protein [Sanguibacter sp. HDW7]|uniref:hypothetical protein n=1 Tax=Sanguibacter sp. HDW7 TaxID=2714931 RepID=UPI00140CB114|nr:hypothetical protein [Sanguibacter sp. HDW7]QIK82996.1 hypothetical protein G7063_04655 [Sanguibacter sp. HDW7]